MKYQSEVKYHIAIVSVLFDKKPEGICTGRLIRALLKRGHRVSLFTSEKADTRYEHKNLKITMYGFRPREPRWLFRQLARLTGFMYSNYIIWSWKVSRVKLKAGDMPDVIYSRAWPHASLVAGYYLSRNNKLPHILHFSDPFPPPNENIELESWFKYDLEKIVNNAACVTFTNSETLEYQKRSIDMRGVKSAVINHISPPRKTYGEPGASGKFYYVGSISENRSPEVLLGGFALHVKDYKDDMLYFVGSDRNYLNKLINKCNLQGNVKVLPFTNNVDRVFSEASCLVSLDVNHIPALYTPTKIVEYLATDRVIFAVTPENSPVSKLLENDASNSVVVTEYRPESIKQGLCKVRELLWDANSFNERQSISERFSEEEVVRALEDQIGSAVQPG